MFQALLSWREDRPVDIERKPLWRSHSKRPPPQKKKSTRRWFQKKNVHVWYIFKDEWQMIAFRRCMVY